MQAPRSLSKSQILALESCYLFFRTLPALLKSIFECRQCCLSFELVTERRRAPCGHNPKAWFLRHTTTLQPGRTLAWRKK